MTIKQIERNGERCREEIVMEEPSPVKILAVRITECVIAGVIAPSLVFAGLAVYSSIPIFAGTVVLAAAGIPIEFAKVFVIAKTALVHLTALGAILGVVLGIGKGIYDIFYGSPRAYEQILPSPIKVPAFMQLRQIPRTVLVPAPKTRVVAQVDLVTAVLAETADRC